MAIENGIGISEIDFWDISCDYSIGGGVFLFVRLQVVSATFYISF